MDGDKHHGWDNIVFAILWPCMVGFFFCQCVESCLHFGGHSFDMTDDDYDKTPPSFFLFIFFSS